jgi:murein tripeptide amidase MpaA
MRKLLCLSVLALITHFAPAQSIQLTVAEKTNFASTSTFNDVISFVNELKTSSRYVKIETIARTTEGRDLPLIIVANPMPGKPEDLLNDSRIVVYIQANIHAGEVEGKEAILMFIRDLIYEKNPTVLRNIIFLFCPIFNADGNEKISKENRTYQNGPVNGVGVRYNGQFLDLNRDAMKAESPEIKGVITNVLNKWDPSVILDCHTTDGSYHVEPTTFTWMVNPNGDKSLIAYLQDKMMPEISGTLLNKFKVENCFYGEFRDMLAPEKGWIFDASEPRYFTNYIGLRNRLAILNENYVYADFKSRVNGCYFLIKSLVDYLNRNKEEIMIKIKETDRKTVERGLNPAVSDSFAIEYEVRSASLPVTIKTFEAELVSNVNGRRNYRKTDRQKTVTVPYYVDYVPVKNVKLPFAYILDTFDPQVVNLLLTHGIKIDKLTTSTKVEVERFKISELKGAMRLNQGHYNNTIKGEFVNDTIEFNSGTLLVRTAQPLANVAAYLLEPQSNDGLITWNFLDRYLVPQWGYGYNPYPVYKVIKKENIKTVPFSL